MRECFAEATAGCHISGIVREQTSQIKLCKNLMLQ